MMAQHPEWLAVGATVRYERRSLGGSVVFERTVTVQRHAPSSVVADYMRFRRVKRGETVAYVESPAYLDYDATLEPLLPEAAR